VCTYGQIAALAGRPRAARHVGYAMAALYGNARGVPWHRVLGARPRGYAAITIRDPSGAALQKKLLAAEGVRFDARGFVALGTYGWVADHSATPIPSRIERTT
jgi:methylated-DNA-protein-cysteine methyltransferase-like protein